MLSKGVADFQLANYFSVVNEGRRAQTLQSHRVFPTDVAFSLGIFEWRGWKAEAGVDYFAGLRSPWFFNAKVGIDENLLFRNAPSFSVGLYDVGTKKGITNFNVLNINIGKTLPRFLTGGRLFAGGYCGNTTLPNDQAGWLVGYLKAVCPAVDCCGTEYHKLWIVADYASGKNPLGGGGAGICYFFSPDVVLTTGPTWFNDFDINGKWKWTVQVDVFFSVCK